jgi:uncharacterized membrane protein YphA (DoxX/SURF4 family)
VKVVRSLTLPGPTRLWDLIGLAARLLLAAVYFVSGILKAADPAETRVAVKGYQLLPDSVAEMVAAVLPYLEIAVALILLVGLATRLGAVLSALMMVAFLIGVISAAARGLSIDCGCFGGGGAVAPGATEYTAEILRDAGLLVVSLYLMLRPHSSLSVDNLGRRAADDGEDGEDDVMHDGESTVATGAELGRAGGSSPAE